MTNKKSDADVLVLTKHEYFAMVALNGILANSNLDPSTTRDWKVSIAVEYADTLLRELNKRKKIE